MGWGLNLFTGIKRKNLLKLEGGHKRGLMFNIGICVVKFKNLFKQDTCITY